MFGTFFGKYRGTIDFQVPSNRTTGTFNKVPSTGTAGSLKKYRAHLCLLDTRTCLYVPITFFNCVFRISEFSQKYYRGITSAKHNKLSVNVSCDNKHVGNLYEKSQIMLKIRHE